MLPADGSCLPQGGAPQSTHPTSPAQSPLATTLPASPRSSAQRGGWEWLTFLAQLSSQPSPCLSSLPVPEPAGLKASHKWTGKPRLRGHPQLMARGTVTSGSMRLRTLPCLRPQPWPAWPLSPCGHQRALATGQQRAAHIGLTEGAPLCGSQPAGSRPGPLGPELPGRWLRATTAPAQARAWPPPWRAPAARLSFHFLFLPSAILVLFPEGKPTGHTKRSQSPPAALGAAHRGMRREQVRLERAVGFATWRRPLAVGGQPAHPRSQRARGTGSLHQGRVVTPGAGDWGLGPSIRNVCQEDVPSAVHPGKGSYQRNLSLKKSQSRNPSKVGHNICFTIPAAPSSVVGSGLCPYEGCPGGQ